MIFYDYTGREGNYWYDPIEDRILTYHYVCYINNKPVNETIIYRYGKGNGKMAAQVFLKGTLLMLFGENEMEVENYGRSKSK